MTGFRGALQELHDAVHDQFFGNDIGLPPRLIKATNDAGMLLRAEPEPEGPTDEQLDELFIEIDQTGEPESWRTYARAVLARWGNSSAPQPIPVSKRWPEPEEMAEEEEVWVECVGYDYPIADTGDYHWEPHMWILRPITQSDIGHNPRWLPAHALPVPSHD